MDSTKNMIETLIDAIGKPATVQEMLLTSAIDNPGMTVLAMPKDMVQVDLTEAMDKLNTKLQPWRRTGTAQMTDLASFVAWANRNKGETSAIFASTGKEPGLLCVADYLGIGAPVMDHESRDPKASHMKHRAAYRFPLSPEWKTWTEINGKPLEKAAFGEFIEANAKDFLDPTPALLAMTPGARGVEDWESRMIGIARQLQGRFGQYSTLMQLARNFVVNEVSNITASLNRDTGESAIQFLNEHQQPDGSPISLPNLIMVAIPIFENGAHYRIPVRFRYRKSGASISFIFQLHTPDVYLKDAVDEAIATAAAETGLPVFRGSPEA